MNTSLAESKRIITEKDKKIETQRSEITKLRKDTFDLKSQVRKLQMQDEERKQMEKEKGNGSGIGTNNGIGGSI